MTSITGRTGGAVEVCWPIERDPPVGSCLYVVGKPFLLRHVPLSREREVVIAPLGEVPLLIAAPVNERDIIEGESTNGFRAIEVAQHGFRVGARVTNNVCHSSLFPAFVFRFVASLATFRADEVRLPFLGTSPRDRQKDTQHPYGNS